MDICFVVDLTASMHWWLQTVNAKMEEIIQDNLEHMGEFARVRVGFVGYRDYDDNMHRVVHPFTTEVGKIKDFLQNLEATGGGDKCEDVLAGLEEALKLEWSATAKVLYLLAETPHHGWRFHVNFEVSADHQTIEDALPSKESVEDAVWLRNKFYDLYAEDDRQWEPMDRAVQEWVIHGGLHEFCFCVASPNVDSPKYPNRRENTWKYPSKCSKSPQLS